MQAKRDLQAIRDRLRSIRETSRQLRLEELRENEHRLNKRAEYLKQERRRLRLDGLWDGGLKAFVGKKIMEIAMEKRDLKEKIKELEGKAEDI